ncbi:MAG: aminotransferase class I/II-fold pyridoxal phosphate-dependent enzyme, partial [Pseudomonadota bacterium]
MFDQLPPTRPATPAFLAARMGPKMRGGRHRVGPVLGDAEPGPGAIQMRSNDYLGLAAHPGIAAAKAAALLAKGHGDAVSRVFAHHRADDHRAFELRMAGLLGAEDAVLTMSGYSANTGLIQAFATRGTPVYLDRRAHASLWDGVTAAGARGWSFRHNDVA